MAGSMVAAQYTAQGKEDPGDEAGGSQKTREQEENDMLKLAQPREEFANITAISERVPGSPKS